MRQAVVFCFGLDAALERVGGLETELLGNLVHQGRILNIKEFR